MMRKSHSFESHRYCCLCFRATGSGLARTRLTELPTDEKLTTLTFSSVVLVVARDLVAKAFGTVVRRCVMDPMEGDWSEEVPRKHPSKLIVPIDDAIISKSQATVAQALKVTAPLPLPAPHISLIRYNTLR